MKESFNVSSEVNKIMDNFELKPNEKMILLDMIIRPQGVNEEGLLGKQLSVEYVCNLLKCTRPTATSVLRSLREKGLVEQIKVGLGVPNIYIYNGIKVN
jgi:predicted transcriptional regulator